MSIYLAGLSVTPVTASERSALAVLTGQSQFAAGYAANKMPVFPGCQYREYEVLLWTVMYPLYSFQHIHNTT